MFTCVLSRRRFGLCPIRRARAACCGDWSSTDEFAAEVHSCVQLVLNAVAEHHLPSANAAIASHIERIEQ